MKRMALGFALTVLLAGSVQAAETLVYDVAFKDALITAKTDALSAGDRIIINDVLSLDGKEAGFASGLCTITEAEKGYAICNVTFVLEAGSISMQFVNSPPPEKHFSIMGGTGAYAGAAGSGILLEHGDQTGKLTLNLL